MINQLFNRLIMHATRRENVKAAAHFILYSSAKWKLWRVSQMEPLNQSVKGLAEPVFSTVLPKDLLLSSTYN